MNEKNTHTPSIILDAVVQFVFADKKEIEDVFVQVRMALGDDFTYTKEPVMEIPPAIRESDPQLRLKPYYRFTSKEMVVKVSPYMISFATIGTYPGWNEFKEKIKKYDDVFSKREVANISTRYINFFENQNIFDFMSITVQTPENIVSKEFDEKRRHYFCEFGSKHGTTVKLQVVNNVDVQTQDLNETNGSIIDVDVHSGKAQNYEQTLDEVHHVAKEVFFGLLKNNA